MHIKVPKQAANYVVTRIFGKFQSEQFGNDIAHIPLDSVDLLDSVDDKLDAFNDLFLKCLNNHAPVKTVKLEHKENPFITEDIRECIATRDRLHKKARRSGTEEDWPAFRSLRRGKNQP